MENKVHPGHVPYGEIQGYANGVPAYSNLHDGHFSGIRNIDVDNKIMTGFRYQCVEFARRWLLERKGLYLPDVDMAANVFTRDYVEDVRDGSKVRMVAVPNNGVNKPVVDAFLIYPRLKGVADWGHIAVITEVSDTFCRIADQNQHFNMWEGAHYSAELHFVTEEGKEGKEGEKAMALSFLEDKLGGAEWRPVGWMIFPDTPNRDPAGPPLQWAEKYTPPTPDIIRLERCVKAIPTVADAKPWLDASNPAEKKFIETFGMDVSRTRLNEAEANYYVCNDEAMMRMYEATNDLHRIFVKQTEKVVDSDELLARFHIPKEFWGRIRKSWATQPHSITGRFDFAVDDANNMKCFEYNADSASTLLECGRIQQKYAEHIGIASDDSWGSGWDIETKLVCAWRRARNHILAVSGSESAEKKLRIHFCVDDDDEEQYTALYVMEMAEKVGIECKLCVMFDEFSFNADGKIEDSEGNMVTTIWKTWMWETAFADFFKAKTDRGSEWKPTPGEKVRLCDLLLGPDDEINVFEPMWKVIPSNKAILPMIYDANPDCPFILPASFELTDRLRKTGYAKKPIVGRTGQNVTVTSESGEPLDSTAGQFSEREMVFQEKFNLKKRHDYYAILGSWVIGGEQAGISVREDKTLITGVESPYSALRIWFDGEAVKKLSEQ